MIVEEKKENESNESLMRRFSRRVQSKGSLKRIKARQFFEKSPNKRVIRKKAVQSAQKRAEVNLLIKKGKIDPNQRGKRRRG